MDISGSGKKVNTTALASRSLVLANSLNRDIKRSGDAASPPFVSATEIQVVEADHAHPSIIIFLSQPAVAFRLVRATSSG